MCLLFAATYPERTLGLLLWGCFARYDWRRSFIGRYWGGETVDDALDRLEREWAMAATWWRWPHRSPGTTRRAVRGDGRSAWRRRPPPPARCCG